MLLINRSLVRGVKKYSVKQDNIADTDIIIIIFFTLGTCSQGKKSDRIKVFGLTL